MSLTALPRGNYFAEPGFVQTDIKKGVTRNRAGTRIICLTSDFLNGLKNALDFECGKASDAVMRTAGRHWGKKFGERLNKELTDFYSRPFNEMPLAIFEGCLAEAFSHHGWGKMKMDVSQYDKGILIFQLVHPVYAELVGSAERPTDPLMAGIFAGIFSFFAGRDLDCIQTQCQACGASDSRFVVTIPERLKDAEDWAKTGKSHMEILNLLQEVRA